MSRDMYLRVKALAVAIDALVAHGTTENFESIMMLSQMLNEELEVRIDESGNL